MGYQDVSEVLKTSARTASDEKIRAMLADALARHDDLFGVRDHLIRRRLQSIASSTSGDEQSKKMAEATAAAKAEWDQALARHPRDVGAPLVAATFYRDAGDASGAKAMVDRALAQRDPTPDQLLQAAQVLVSLGEADRAAKIALQAADEGMRLSGPRASAARLLAQIGQTDRAAAEANRALETSRKHAKTSGEAATSIGIGILGVELDLRAEAAIRSLPPEQLAAHAKELGVPIDQDHERLAGAVIIAERARRGLDGLSLLRQGTSAFAGSGWELASVGTQLRQMGSSTRRADLLNEAVVQLERARDVEPQAPSIRHDLAVAYYTAGKNEEAVRELREAAKMAPSNAFLAQRLGELLDQLGKVQEAAHWFGEAKLRGEKPEPAAATPGFPPKAP
jgi:tetratricopeptide (TPR) repeat protein